MGGLGATPVGTPQQVADQMERWVREADVDGFNLVSLDDILMSGMSELTAVAGICSEAGFIQGHNRPSHP